MTVSKSKARIAVGIKSHSGWAAVVVVAISKGGLEIIDRRRIELVEPVNISWAKQPYHAAEGLDLKEARLLIERAIKAARQIAARELKRVFQQLAKEGHEIAGCALLTGAPMPAWSAEQILTVHVRMHMAEGVMFPDAMSRAITKCGVALVEVREKQLAARIAEVSSSPQKLTKEVAALGKIIGPPWTTDQKNATLAVAVAFGKGLV